MQFDVLNFLYQQEYAALIGLFWFALLFDIPRYVLGFLAIAIYSVRNRPTPYVSLASFPGIKNRAEDHPLVSVLVIGHNEAGTIERCARSLWNQTLQNMEIIVVSDGSTDGMERKAQELVESGIVDRCLSTDIRCGKSAAFNLGYRFAKGDFIINVDCDSSFQRDALERLIVPLLQDPKLGATSGQVNVRNGSENLLTIFQLIEYLTVIAVGRRIMSMFNQLTCLSGAFVAFRKTALDHLGGMDVGGGEDFEITLRLRQNGWKVAFIHESECFTAVPTKLKALVNQRLRWERDTVRIRFRKHQRMLNPFSSDFKGWEAYHYIEFLFSNVISAIAFPVYLVIIFVFFGDYVWHIILWTQVGYMFMDVFIFLAVIFVSQKWRYIFYLPFAIGYGLFNSFFMRFLRLFAYSQEWLFDSSRNDSFVPERVRMSRKW